MQYIKAASAIGMASLNGHQQGSFRGKSLIDTYPTIAIENVNGALAGASAGMIHGPPGALAGAAAGICYTAYN